MNQDRPTVRRAALVACALLVALSSLVAPAAASARPRPNCSVHTSPSGLPVIVAGTYRFNHKQCGPTPWQKGADWTALRPGWHAEIKDTGSTCVTDLGSGDQKVTRPKQILRCGAVPDPDDTKIKTEGKPTP